MNEPDSRKPWWEADHVWRPDDAEEPAPLDAEAVDAELGPTLIPCWRCGQAVEEALSRCPKCFARFDSPKRGSRRRNEANALPSDSGGLMPVIWFFISQLCVSLVLGLSLYAIVQNAGDRKALANDRVMCLVVIAEC